MSYCALILFKEGKQLPQVQFRNAWGGSVRIWDSLFEAYITKKHKYDHCLQDTDRLWNLAKDSRLQQFERAALCFTFDLFYVRKENFSHLYSDLQAFAHKYPVPGKVDHLPAWAEYLNSADCDAIALMGTSVSENLWTRLKKCPHCDQSLDEYEDVPFSKGTEVYECMERNPTKEYQ